MPRTPWENRAEFEKLAGRQADLGDVLDQLRNGMDPRQLQKARPNGPDWSRFGYAAVEPDKSPFVQPTVYKNKQYLGAMQKQMSAALSEDAINRAAMEMFSPYTEPPTRRPRVPKAPGTMDMMKRVSPVAAALDLLSYTGDTNSNEAMELQNRRGPAYSNRGEYDAMLQSVLNSGNARMPGY